MPTRLTALCGTVLYTALCFAPILAGAQPTARRAGSGTRSVPPDLVLTGGKVFTADSAHPWAEALAIRGDRIIAVGTSMSCIPPGALTAPLTTNLKRALTTTSGKLLSHKWPAR